MKVTTDGEKIKILLSRAVNEIINRDSLEAKLKSGKVLRVKLGIDPTAPDIHLGHTVSLIKLKQFQDLGHKAVLIIGDFTATIGDPAGRLESRKPLLPQIVAENLKTYLKQIVKIVDIKKTEVRYNNEWFGKITPKKLFFLTSLATIQQALEREDFQKRLKSNQAITLTEVLYSLFQGYDSVMVKADIEIGGEDQKVNLLMGRRVQRAYKVPEQDILTTWLIEGTDGAKKMSKSSENYIGIAEKPNVMFGKVMSIPDSLIIKYFRALTMIADSEIDKFEMELRSKKTNPRDIKGMLAFEIVRMYHGEKNAKEADEEFNKVFRKHELPKKIPIAILKKGPYDIIDLLLKLNLVKSKSEARRLVNENAVKINSEIVKDPKIKINIASGLVVQIGKKRFVKIGIK
ncbi:MAG: tyrosine--tRNA ligase [bacterium]|nr:tyrosine--tRNA ligase [bacterium]